MKWFVLGMTLLLGACASLPTIAPVDIAGPSTVEDSCRSHFPQGRWQLVHTLTARFPGGRQATFTGVVVLSTTDRSLHCVLLTLEGMVLFEADHDGRQLTVSRAFGPFDNPHFAQGVMDDIRFLFFEPGSAPITTGTLDDGSLVCRYRGDGQTVVDLFETGDGGWGMRQYDERGRTLRRVTAGPVNGQGIAPRMTIDAGSGLRSYHLSLNLVEATPRR